MAADASLFPATLPVLTAMRHTASGRQWLAELPDVVRELRERWELRLGAPYHGGSCAWVAPAVRADGVHAVLKVTWPHREARPEGRTMRAWRGRGAAVVYEQDARHRALLLERCEPGTPLWQPGRLGADERLSVGCAVLRRLWAAGDAGDGARGEGVGEVQGAGEGEVRGEGEGSVAGLRPPPRGDRGGGDAPERLADVAAEWADLVDERAAGRTWPRGVDTGLFATGAALLRELPRGAGRDVVLHGDFNPGNVLAARREPWLAIDAKPMVGDAAYDPWPLIEQLDGPLGAFGGSGQLDGPGDDLPALLRHRTDLAAEALGVDVTRLRAWALARHVEYVLWSADRTEHTEHTDRTNGADQSGPPGPRDGDGRDGQDNRNGRGNGSEDAGEVPLGRGGFGQVALDRMVPLMRRARTLAEVAGL